MHRRLGQRLCTVAPVAGEHSLHPGSHLPTLSSGKVKFKFKFIKGYVYKYPSSWAPDGLLRGSGREGEDGEFYRGRSGNLSDTRSPPPGSCFNCDGAHWRKDCPIDYGFAKGLPACSVPLFTIVLGTF